MSREILISVDWADQTPFDLSNLFKYAVAAPFEIPAQATIHACVFGENDESSWFWIFEVADQTYFASGGCDFTGWDCQSWGEVTPVGSIEEALDLAPEQDGDNRNVRKYLSKQIDGEEQIGVYTLEH